MSIFYIHINNVDSDHFNNYIYFYNIIDFYIFLYIYEHH